MIKGGGKGCLCRFLLSMLLTLSLADLRAQGSPDLIISGLIQNSVNGFTPIPNHPVNILGDALAPPTNLNVVTNASGIFSVVIPNGSVAGFPAGFTISALGCGQNFQQNISNTGGSTDSVFVVLSICYSPSTACTPGFVFFNDPMGPFSFQFTFQDTSLSGNPVSWLWDFGDGTQDSGSALISHEYLLPGFYEVCEIMQGLAGCSSTVCDSVAVGMPGACQLTVMSQLDTINQNLDLDLTFNTAGYSGEYYVNVDYGDFNEVAFFTSDSSLQLTHSYLAAGFYTVRVTMISGVGCADSVQLNLVVPVQNCQAGIALLSIQSQIAAFQGTFAPYFPGDSLAAFIDFGDGVTQNMVFVGGQFLLNHSYTIPGPQLICITLTDPTGCSSSSCLPFFVAPGCSASMEAFPDFASGSYIFQSTSSYAGSLAQLTWDMGNGVSLPGLAGPVNYQYQQPGIYNVCLSLLTQGGCSSSVCDTLVVGDGFNCEALVSPVLVSDTLNSAVRLELAFQSLFPGEVMQYSFNWGDGSPALNSLALSGNTLPVSKPLLPGGYQACLVVGNVSGCTDTMCYTINYEPSLMALRLSAGVVTQNYQDFSYAFYRFDDALNEWTLHQEASPSDSSFYQNLALPLDTYLLHVRLDPTHPAFPFVIPSYFHNRSHWQDAGFISPVANTVGQPFRQIRTEYGQALPTSGSNSISGDLVFDDAMQTPVSNAGVLLLDQVGNALKSFRTGTDGKWFFDNLPTGIYYVFPEVVNKITYPIEIQILTPGSDILNQRMTIRGSIISGGNQAAQENRFRVFPNPFESFIWVDGLHPKPAEVTLTTTTGQLIAQKRMETQGPIVFSNLSELPKGMYFLEVKSAGATTRLKLIK